MIRINAFKFVFFLLAMLSIVMACQKFNKVSSLSSPAYIRVFNDISNRVDILHKNNANSVLTFIMDPDATPDKIPLGGKIVADYLNTRYLYSLSYSSLAANSGKSINSIPITVKGNQDSISTAYSRTESSTRHFEYPGSAHVQTAPIINGLDLSAWAQVSSGTHRIVFISRPITITPFSDLVATDRNRVIVDTTVDLKAGEVYTLEAVNSDQDSNKYSLYIRQEDFIHQKFSLDNNYVSFYNLSGQYSRNTEQPIPTLPYQVRYSNYSNSSIYLTTIEYPFEKNAQYLPQPILDSSQVFNFQKRPNFYGYYLETVVSPEVPHFESGTIPGSQYTFFPVSSVIYNTFNFPPTITTRAEVDPIRLNTYSPEDPLVQIEQVNVNQIFLNQGKYTLYPSINIFEVVYNKVYMMQILQIQGKVLNPK